MKKISLLIGLIVLTASVVRAQPSETTPEGLTKNPKFRMGLSVSSVVSWLNPDGDDSFVDPDGVRFNIGYGLHTDFGLGTNQNYYFSTGIFVLNTGGRLKYTYRDPANGQDYARTIDYRMNYINIPLTMMLRTNEIGYSVYFARVGVDNGIKIKSAYNSKDVGPSGTFAKDDANSPDYSMLYRAALHIEGGVEFNVTGTTNIFVSLTWNNGLNNVFSSDAKAVNKDLSLKGIKGNSNALMLTLGAYF